VGALSYLVPVLIDLNVGAFRLEFLHALETSLMDDWGVMVSRSMDFERVAHHSLGGWELCRLYFSVQRGTGILLIGEDVLALVLTLSLGYARMECKQQLPRLAEEVDSLIVEKDINLQFLESPERDQKIHAVASKPVDLLGVDHVDLSRLAVGQQALESRTRTDGSS